MSGRGSSSATSSVELCSKFQGVQDLFQEGLPLIALLYRKLGQKKLEETVGGLSASGAKCALNGFLCAYGREDSREFVVVSELLEDLFL